MTVRITHTPQVQGLQISLSNTMEQIDRALDAGDRRAFRLWSSRYRSQTARVATLLLQIATSEV